MENIDPRDLKVARYKSIALMISIQLLFLFKGPIMELPNGGPILIVGMLVLTVGPLVLWKYRPKRYLDAPVIGKFVKLTAGGGWSYWVQVDGAGWVEDLEVDFRVYRVIQDGDAYNGMHSSNYPSRLLNRPVPKRMVDRASFERAMLQSLEEEGPDPLQMVVIWMQHPKSKRKRTYVFYVGEWDE